jgi:hypothetical protein
VLQQAEDIQLPIVFIPITTDAFKAARAVIEGVRHDADLGLIDGDNRPLEKRVLSHNRCSCKNFARAAGQAR